MFKLAVLSALLAAATAAPKIYQVPALDGRIVGGNNVDIENFPYQLSLLYYGSHICGASLISSKYAVTAAHCTSGSSASQLSIRAGSSTRNSGGEVVGIKVINQHPSFNSSTFDYDISILELDSALTFSKSIATVALPNQDQDIPTGATSIVSGWGVLMECGPLPSFLQAVEVQVVSNDDCADAYCHTSITDRMMCAGVPNGGKDACQGDSGGPLVIDGQLIGIVSWGFGCARPDFPGVYSSVPALRNYITTTSGI